MLNIWKWKIYLFHIKDFSLKVYLFLLKKKCEMNSHKNHEPALVSLTEALNIICTKVETKK